MTIETGFAPKGVAKRLQVAKDTVNRWIAKEGLPAAKAGRVWRFKLSEVDECLRTGGAIESKDDSVSKP